MYDYEQPGTAVAPRVEVAAASAAGTRALNADAYLIDEAAGLFGVADGMGAIPKSREVSMGALRILDETFQSPWVLLPYPDRAVDEAKERLVQGIARAHARLSEPRAPGALRIGTTLAALVVCGDGCIAGCHVGNSRIYLLSRERRTIVRLTDDHTVLCASQLWGVPRKEAPSRNDARTLTQAIGATRAVSPVPVVERWAPGDVALLCTDGVSDHVEPEEMAERLLMGGNLRDLVQRLVQRARASEGHDDATALLVRRLA
jgi:serine/threonine protein phosphatase PrpC